MRAARRLFAVAAVSVVLLSACGSADEETTAAGSPNVSASPSSTPTPAPVIWAGEVCVARDNLGAAVGALGRNLSYDITSDRSALEQIDRQLRMQVLSVGDALNTLGETLTGVPADFQEANDFVATTTKIKQDTEEAIAATQANLDAMVNADNVVGGVAAAGQALVSAKAAFEAGTALVSEVTGAISDKGSELSAAFDAAPACQGS